MAKINGIRYRPAPLDEADENSICFCDLKEGAVEAINARAKARGSSVGVEYAEAFLLVRSLR